MHLVLSQILRPLDNFLGILLKLKSLIKRIYGDLPSKTGDNITVLPSGFKTKIKSIDTFEGSIDEAYSPMSVCMTLEDNLDISRGDMLVRENNQLIINKRWIQYGIIFGIQVGLLHITKL